MDDEEEAELTYEAAHSELESAQQQQEEEKDADTQAPAMQIQDDHYSISQPQPRPEYTSLHRINHSNVPRHRGKQKSYQSLATELTHYTRQTSLKSHQTAASLASVQYSVVSAYSSFVPEKNGDILQVGEELDATKSKSQTRLIYGINIALFVIFWALLHVHATKIYAEYGILVISLALSLIYTMIPSYIPIPIPCVCRSESQRESDAESYANRDKQETFIMTVRKWRFPLDQSTVPVICVLLLIASQDSHFAAIHAWNSITGHGQPIRPWQVLGTLFGLCYLCITLDLTGILKGLAQKTADASGSYQSRLFLYIFLFAAILTVITNNDISIICLTPLVCSTANAANIESAPYIYMVLFTSNTFSMLLVTGNPANLIVQQAAKLDYVTYLQYMVIPTIVTGVALYAELYVLFRKDLRRRFQIQNTTDWKQLVKLPRYSVFCALRLVFACIGIPIVGQIQDAHKNEPIADQPLDMYVVLGTAVLSCIIDLMAFDIRRLAAFSAYDYSANHPAGIGQRLLDEEEHNIIGGHQQAARYNKPNLLAIDETQEEDTINTSIEMRSLNDASKTMKAMDMHETVDSRVTHETFATYDSNHLLYDKLKLTIETFAFDALWELPWKLIPFVFGLFILIGYMKQIGLVDYLAHVLVSVATDEWSAMFIVGFTAAILCQCVNNQPMTVLMATVLAQIQNDEKGEYGEVKWINGAYFALAIGANLGGNGTPIASLAVLMWQGILAKWNIYPRYFAFSIRGLGVTPLLVTVSVVFVAIGLLYLFPAT